MSVLTEDFTIQFGNNGIILNTEIIPGQPFVDLTKIAGLDNAPVDSTDRQREGMDGGFVDAEFESIRSVVLEGTVYGSEQNVESYLDQLKANFAPSAVSKPLYVMMPGVGLRVLFCKSMGLKYDIDTYRRVGTVNIQVTLKAEDPAFYGPEVIATAYLGTSNVYGRGYNKSFDYGYGGSGQRGPSVSLANTGNRPASATLFIYGPVTTPSVHHDQSGTKMIFDTVLEVGDVLEVNLRNRSVVLNGTANRRNVLLGRAPWFDLPPGINVFRFDGTQHVAGPPDARLDIVTRPAYR